MSESQEEEEETQSIPVKVSKQGWRSIRQKLQSIAEEDSEFNNNSSVTIDHFKAKTLIKKQRFYNKVPVAMDSVLDD